MTIEQIPIEVMTKDALKIAANSSVEIYKPTKGVHGDTHTHAEPSRKHQKNVPVIKVNGHTIDQKALAEEVQYHPSADFDKAAQKAGQALVIKHLLQQQVSAKELEAKGEEQAVADLVERNIKEVPPTEDDCLRYYQQNMEKFKTVPLLEVSHILLAAGPNDIGLRIKQNQVSKKLINQLQGNLDLFGSLVEKYSDCPSKKMAGSLGQLSKGQTVPEFERQLFPLPEGLHDKALESRYGYHIVFVNKKIEGKQLEFPMVENKINNYLVHRRHRQAISNYLYELASDQEIEGIELQLEQDNIAIA